MPKKQRKQDKETTLERADLLLMFVTSEKERELFITFFLSSFCTADLSYDRLSAPRPWKLRPTGLEGSSF